MELQLLTASEEQLMQILWKLDSFYLKDIAVHYPEPKPHQNTISTFLKILTEKQFLTTEKEGRIFKYTVSVSKKNYRKFLVQKLLEQYFENSGSELLKSLLEDQVLSSNDLAGIVKVKVVPIVEENQPTKEETKISEFLDELIDKKKDKKDKKKKKSKKKK